MTKRGLLVVMEGCDRAGKSTQCQLLVDFLNDSAVPAKLYRFPNRTTEIGSTINSYLASKSELDDRAIHLLFSANRWELFKEMKADLDNGVTLVLDRYSYSGIAFSVAKGLDFEWCRAPDAGLLEPDLVLYLDLSMDEIISRGGFGQERYETRDFQLRVKDVFEKFWLGAEDQKSSFMWKRIAAACSISELQESVRDIVQKALEKNLEPLRLLK